VLDDVAQCAGGGTPAGARRLAGRIGSPHEHDHHRHRQTRRRIGQPDVGATRREVERQSRTKIANLAAASACSSGSTTSLGRTRA